MQLRGQLTATFDQLHAAGCIQTLADIHDDVQKAKEHGGRMFQALMHTTGDNPCSGCPAYGGGTCVAFKRYFVRPFVSRPERPQYRGTHKPRCPKCKLKIRGANHDAHCVERSSR
jgi:hypothetical protein